MVQTRAATRRIESGQELPQDTAVTQLPTKKRRTEDGTSPPKKRRRGKPSELCQLNLDVLFLLAAYIHPLDLLNLARTCKSLRELLMDKSSEFVWKTARRQVRGLPDCPADLTEPEYANLVFHARCHGCGKYAKKILWEMRRRYCPECRQTRLCSYSSCNETIQLNYVIATENLIINGEKGKWVDREQMHSFLQEYDRSSDKVQLLREKREQRCIMYGHALKCKDWEDDVASEHKYDLELRRRERDDGIFERLKQHGYQPEIAHFGYYAIKNCHMSFFKTSKPLTDKEWARMWPEWSETMKTFRSQRIDKMVYQPRRQLLMSEYANYVKSPSPTTPVFNLLPHVTDLFRFPPFRDIIRAPEGTELGPKPFESVFEQLPALVDEWRKQLDAGLAELVVIPADLSSKGTSSDRAVASSSTIHMESSGASTDKLRLACATFDTGYIVTRYPEMFSSMHHQTDVIRGTEDSECIVSVQDRFRVKFMKEAPYIIHACGMDPNVATVEDMDRRNARLKCLVCNDPYIRDWRNALRHSLHCQTLHPESLRWERINDEHMDAVQTAELSATKDLSLISARCLLCRPCVGDSMTRYEVLSHLVDCHDMKRDDIEQDVHYASMYLHAPPCLVKMVEEGGQVMFKGPDKTFL
ncbi:hypothetical protein EV363DRAFT_1204107 [Boletus edulis]|nr:hypothetical protein EV363DRAFT_1204107 [Boletus edulis]